MAGTMDVVRESVADVLREHGMSIVRAKDYRGNTCWQLWTRTEHGEWRAEFDSHREAVIRALYLAHMAGLRSEQ